MRVPSQTRAAEPLPSNSASEHTAVSSTPASVSTTVAACFPSEKKNGSTHGTEALIDDNFLLVYFPALTTVAACFLSEKKNGAFTGRKLSLTIISCSSTSRLQLCLGQLLLSGHETARPLCWRIWCCELCESAKRWSNDRSLPGKMNNLLSKTFSVRGRNYVDLKADSRRDGVELEMQSLDPEQAMKGFFQEVDDIKREMDVIKQLLAKLQDGNEEAKSIHRAQAMKALRDRMDKDVADVSKTARSIKVKLEQLDKANSASRRTRGCEEGSPTDRTRTSITNTLRKKLKDYMEEFGNLRARIMGEYRETVERRYFTVTGEKPDESTLEHIIETGDSENFLQKAIQEQGRGQVLETIREIQERHDGVKEIEKNLLELHQIFLDMAVLVEAQGEQLNDIESNVNQARSFVERASTQLHVAKKHQRNTRKWMCIGIVLVLIVILIIILSLKPWTW